MTKIIVNMLRLLGQRALDYYDREPVRVHTAVATAVVATAAAAGLILSAPLVIVVVGLLAPAIVGSVRKVVASPDTQVELALTEPPEVALDAITDSAAVLGR